MSTIVDLPTGRGVRAPAVAGSFYPDSPSVLRSLVAELFQTADMRAAGLEPVPGTPTLGIPVGILVPHAGLEWSGIVAAAAWRLLRPTTAPRSVADGPSPTIVILGTNHSAWLVGVGAWETGAWETPLGDVAIDGDVAAGIVALGPPFAVDRAAHLREHSIEVQLPLLRTASPTARIVPLAVSAGTGAEAIEAGTRLGRWLGELRAGGTPVVLAISTDMAHYPRHRDCARATEALAPSILALDAAGLAARERAVSRSSVPDLVCGMCGIEPSVLGLAALAALGPLRATRLAAATSADAGGPADRTVGYLAAAWSAPTDVAAPSR